MNEATPKGLPRVALAAIARPTFDVPLAQSVADAAAELISLDSRLCGPAAALIMDAAGAEAALAALAAEPFDLLVLLQASFADSSMAVLLASVAQERGIPVLLWAVPDTRDGGRLRLNSLCGINLGGHALALRGIAYDYLLAPPDDPAARQKLLRLARTGRALRTLHGSAFGVFGEHPGGFDTCHYDVPDLQQLFGVAVQPVPLDELLAGARSADLTRRETFLARARSYAPNLDDLDPAAALGTAGVYAALQDQVSARSLQGVAVRCWPEFFTELGCAACGAMSVLNEDRCPASCEADVNGTLTSLLLQTLADGQAFLSDLVSIEDDAEGGTGVFWHCGLAPFDMADPQTGVRGTIHSNRKLPLLFEFALKPGRITLARLHRTPHGYQLAIGGGEMISAPRSFGGTSGVVRFDRPAVEVFERIMRYGLEHHFSIVYGDWRAELAACAHFRGLPLLDLTA